MGLKSELGDEGFQAFDAWSQGGASYDPRACRDTWRSIKSEGGITGATIFKMARDAGWRPDRQATPEERQAHQKRQEAARQSQEAQAQREAQKRQESQQAAAVEARKRWDAAPPADHQHEYLARKKVRPHGLRQQGDALLLAIFDEAGEVVNLQEIRPDGSKLYLPGSRKKGCHGIIDGDQTGPLVIGEGFATCASLAEATGCEVWVAMDAGNLVGVAKLARLRHGHEKAIVIAADDDRIKPGNPGPTKARAAARDIGGVVAIPPPEMLGEAGRDFNDLAQGHGLEPVREAVEAALAGPAETPDQGETQAEICDQADARDKTRRKFPFEVVEWTKGRRNGTYFLPPADGDEQPEPLWICAPLHITARTRDAHQGNHGRLLEFDDPDGHRHAWPMPMSLLAGDGTELRSTLLSKGLEISTVRKARDWLAEYLQRSRPESVARCVDRTGWHHGVFVFPDATMGETEERVLLQTAAGDLHGFEVAETLESWQREVASMCVSNSRLVFAVSAAFAAALLHLVGEESGGFNFTGSSSVGKTVALRVAVSVWGGPERLQRWRATSNGLESVALLHNDALLCLDELGQVDSRDAGEIAYMLANGAGKARSNRDGTARRKASWQLLFLSSGEIGLAEHMRAAGKRSRAGQEVRLADIPADAGAGHGLFENLHHHQGGAAFAQALDRAARTCYGTAARAFIAGLVANPTEMSAAIDAFRRKFMAETLPMLAPGREVDGQIHRAAGRFALVAAAGELATEFGVTGWPPGEAIQASRVCLEAWVTGRGGTGPKENETALAQVRLFFEQHGESRFSRKDGTDSRPTINRAGFRSEVDGRTEWWVLPEVFRSEVCQGMDPRFASRLLVERGWIKPDAGNSATVKARLPGVGFVRCYHFVAVGGEGE